MLCIVFVGVCVVCPTQYVWCISHRLVKSTECLCLFQSLTVFKCQGVCGVATKKNKCLDDDHTILFQRQTTITQHRGTWTTINNLAKYTTLYLYSHVKSLYYKQPWFLFSLTAAVVSLLTLLFVFFLYTDCSLQQTDFTKVLFNSNDFLLPSWQCYKCNICVFSVNWTPTF